MAQSKKERLLAMIGKTKAVRSRQRMGGEIPTSEARGCFAPKESELEGEGLHEQISNETNDIDAYSSMFAEGRVQS